MSGNRRRWIAAAIGALIVVTAFALLVRIPEVPRTIVVRPAAPAAKSRSSVDFAQTPATSEEAAMYDQRPLFLPTERNATLGLLTAPEAGQTILDQDALKFTFGAADLKLSLPSPVQVPEGIVEAVLADAPPIPLHGFGRKETKAVKPAARGGFVEIVDARTNRRVFAEPLPVEARPGTDAPWAPVEFLAVVDAAGLVGPLAIVERSEVEEVDAHFRNYLARTYRVGERLAPGRYRIIVGP